VSLTVNPATGRPPCPKSNMNMIVVGGFDEAPEMKTFECINCGHVKRSQAPAGETPD
jgi:hypothetical protein